MGIKVQFYRDMKINRSPSKWYLISSILFLVVASLNFLNLDYPDDLYNLRDVLPPILYLLVAIVNFVVYIRTRKSSNAS